MVIFYTVLLNIYIMNNLIISADVAIMIKREGSMKSYNVKYLNMLNVSVLLFNVLLWIDLNITMTRKKRSLPGGLR